MVLAARWLNIPVITMYDYEHTETWIFNRFSKRVLVPEMIPDNVLEGIGLNADRRVKYPGLKEEVYLHYFSPKTDFRSELLSNLGVPINDSTVLVVIRPPATTANYHDPKSERVFEAILDRISRSDSARALIVPRTNEQKREIEQLLAQGAYSNERLFVLQRAVNGLALANAADLMISGGGTMNREAALLGLPVYSIFSGKLGSIDARMESDERIIFIRSTKDVEKINLVARDRSDHTRAKIDDRVERFVIEQINSFLSRA
jgi:predicted glycosyltransferase